MIRDLAILHIARKFWVCPRGQVKVPFSDGKFYRVFTNMEAAVDFRNRAQWFYDV